MRETRLVAFLQARKGPHYGSRETVVLSRRRHRIASYVVVLVDFFASSASSFNYFLLRPLLSACAAFHAELDAKGIILINRDPLDRKSFFSKCIAH